MEREERVLKALANRKRLEILRLLKVGKEEFGVSEIARRIRLSVKSTSRHLIRLEQVGLIKKDRYKNFVISHVPKQIWQILGLLQKMFYRNKK